MTDLLARLAIPLLMAVPLVALESVNWSYIYVIGDARSALPLGHISGQFKTKVDADLIRISCYADTSVIGAVTVLGSTRIVECNPVMVKSEYIMQKDPIPKGATVRVAVRVKESGVRMVVFSVTGERTSK